MFKLLGYFSEGQLHRLRSRVCTRYAQNSCRSGLRNVYNAMFLNSKDESPSMMKLAHPFDNPKGNSVLLYRRDYYTALSCEHSSVELMVQVEEKGDR